MTAAPNDPYAPGFVWPSPAKINRFLHITGRRADGYHELQTIFQFLDFGDDLVIHARGDGQLRREGDNANIPEEDDLIIRAGKLLRQACGAPDLGAQIRLTKRIPMGGGLGGGSSNAATTLVALNRLWNSGFTPDELAHMGLRLGADVPVFVRGLAAWAEGVGERLRPVQIDEPWFLVATPPVSVSTAAVFSAPELQRDCPRITLEDFLAGQGGNVCEPVTFAHYPLVREVHQRLSAFGSPRMSGTGSSCFVACADEASARAAQQALPREWTTFVAKGLNRSPLADIS